VLVRTVSGGLFVLFFNFVIYAGHFYTVLFVFLMQFGCFREMVRVGVNPSFERKLPGFLPLQWAWFATAACHTYGAWLHDLVEDPAVDTSGLPNWLNFMAQYQAILTLGLFGAVFVASVLSLAPPQQCYLYQLQRLAFTIVSLAMIFGQMQGTPGAIYKGLIWYFVPASVVATNDIMAYFSGVAVGRCFVDRPLLKLSPNKTFEGFFGAIIWTALFAFLFTGHVASFKWMSCPAPSLSLQVHSTAHLAACDSHAVFKFMPSGDLPSWWPLELTGPVRPVQLHMVAVSVFASLVGPFGGFLASAIKRAYDIKDFAAFLPGHGGLMDRNDCQMITALFVSVWLRTFVR
jgi:phosphatidate cytidylyltransferase